MSGPHIQQLNEAHRELLQSFSVFREAVPLKAVQAVVKKTPKAQILPAFKVLRMQHLIQAREEGLYQLHAIISEYIQNHFDEHDENANKQTLQAAHIRASQYYLQQAKRFSPNGKRRQISDIQPLIEAFWQQCQAEKWREAYNLLVQEDIFTHLISLGGSVILQEVCLLLLSSDKWQAEPEQVANIYSYLGQALSSLGKKKKQKCILREHAISLKRMEII